VSPASTTPPETGAVRLSFRDEAKPFILIAAIAAGIVLNRVADGALSSLKPIVTVGLFVAIYSIMAFVEIGDVGQAFRKRKPTALAITTNYIVVPLFAWSLGWLFLRHHSDLWAGVILYTLTPCIGWYLIFIDLAKGNMEWGLAMLPIDIVLQFTLLPVYLWLLVGNVIPIDIWQLLRSVGLFLLLPFAAAYLVRTALLRWKGREFTNGRYRRATSEAKLWALVAVVIGIFATQPRIANTELGRVGLIVATITAFFVGLFLIALAVGRVFRLGYADTTTMVFEVTARNSESVVGVAAIAFAGRPLVMLAILIGPIVELPALLGLTRIMLHLRHAITWPAGRLEEAESTAI
jgi:arsenite transporter